MWQRSLPSPASWRFPALPFSWVLHLPLYLVLFSRFGGTQLQVAFWGWGWHIIVKASECLNVLLLYPPHSAGRMRDTDFRVPTTSPSLSLLGCLEGVSLRRSARKPLSPSPKFLGLLLPLLFLTSRRCDLEWALTMWLGGRSGPFDLESQILHLKKLLVLILNNFSPILFVLFSIFIQSDAGPPGSGFWFFLHFLFSPLSFYLLEDFPNLVNFSCETF